MKIITVVAAIWQDAEGRFFLARRAEGRAQAGLWEFPGGKVEEDEDEKTALARELFEELEVEVEVGDFMMETLHRYNEEKTVLLRAYKIVKAQGIPQLKEHSEITWVSADFLKDYEFCPADLPIVAALIKTY